MNGHPTQDMGATPLRALAAAAAVLCLGAASLCVAADVRGTRIDGFWRSRGYGLVLEVRGELTSLYDVTSISCLKRPSAVATSEFLIEPRLLAQQEMVAASQSELTEFYYERVRALPTSCSAVVRDPRDPLWNFDVFWQYFEDYYAFFEARALDWSAVRATYRPRVRANMPEEELFALLAQILRQFQDSHVVLRAADRLADGGISAIYREWYDEYVRQGTQRDRAVYFKQRIRETFRPAWDRYLDSGSVRDLHPNLLVGTLAGGTVGYVMVAAESDFAAGGTATQELVAAKELLGRAFDLVRKQRALVLDLRFNLGGDDRVALELAGRVAPSDVPGVAKCARDGAGYTPLQQTRVARHPHAFDGPVIVLTSRQTISAGENFLMVVRTFPQVLVVVETTAGVHSDVLRKPLPNGWQLGLSNEIFLSASGMLYEAVGIAPDILVPFFPKHVRTNGIDPAIEKALHLVSETRRSSAQLQRLKAAPRVGRPAPCSLQVDGNG